MKKVCYINVPGFLGYRVGSDGTVWTRRERRYRRGAGRVGVEYVFGDEWRLMKPSVHKLGYLEVILRKNGVGFHKLVHRLVLEAFVGPCPKVMESRHYPDDDKRNCRLSNLSWASKKVNQNDRFFHGTHSAGERHGVASMTNATAKAIRKRFKTIKNKAQIAREFGLSRFAVSRVIRGLSYRV